jgi:hypothetical protein
MNKWLPFILLCLFLGGCNRSTLIATSPTHLVVDNIEYSAEPYNAIKHEQLRIDPLLTDLGLSTTLVLRVKNLNATPIKTSLLDTMAIQNDALHQFRPVKNASVFIRDQNTQPTGLTPMQARDLEVSIQYQLEQPVTSQNVEYYQVQLTELRQKLNRIEQNQQLQEEITRREHVFQEILTLYGFRDQVLFSQGEHEGLVVFPPITSAQTSTSIKVIMLAGNGQVISFNYSVKP